MCSVFGVKSKGYPFFCRLENLVSQLRHWITKQRVHKTLQQLPATSYEMLPVLFDLAKHPLKDLSQNRMYIRLHRWERRKLAK